MKNILCIEDNPEMALLLKGALSKYNVTIAGGIGDAKNYLNNNKFDLVTLDLGLPDGEGIDIVNDLNETSVFIVTSDGDLEKKLKAFSFGVEDYLTKPITPLEIRARVDGKFKRDAKLKNQLENIKINDIQINIPKQRVVLLTTNEILDLTSLELRMFIVFIENKGEVLKRDYLLREVWGENVFLSDRTVDTHVGHLRKKISKSQIEIQTVIGEGYRLT